MMVKRKKTDNAKVAAPGARGRAARAAVAAPTDEAYAESLEHKAAQEETMHVIVFYLGRRQYAVDVEGVVEVVKPRGAITRLPRMPGFIKGVLSVRGEMVPVMDLKSRCDMGTTSVDASCRVLVAASEGRKLGLIVDRMVGMVETPKKLVTPDKAEDKRAPRSKSFLKGAVRLNRGKAHLFHLDRVFDFQG